MTTPAEFVEQNQDLLLQTLKEMTCIPAPSRGEHRRAGYCLDRLSAWGVPGLHVDEAGNVVCTAFAAPEGENALFMAHLDTVFPEETPLIIRVDGSRWSCPGIGDDTVNAVLLMLAMKYMAERGGQGAIFALNTCEEGLGNLAGCRRLMADFAPRLREVVSFDLYRDEVYTGCIGSLRYRISVEVQGGHSFHDFGRPNAVAVLASAIDRLYRFAPPPGTHTTYNVGTLQGGTSVNVIAQQASALFEYRSEDARALRACDKFLEGTLEGFMRPDVRVRLETVGERPCMGDVDAQAIREIAAVCSEAIEAETGVAPAWGRASTDCNIPLSMGIPAVCCGLCRGGGAHTLQEWIDIASVPAGARAALRIREGRLH